MVRLPLPFFFFLVYPFFFSFFFTYCPLGGVALALGLVGLTPGPGMVPKCRKKNEGLNATYHYKKNDFLRWSKPSKKVLTTFEKGYFDCQDDYKKESIETPLKKMFQRPTQRSKKIFYLYRWS